MYKWITWPINTAPHIRNVVPLVYPTMSPCSTKDGAFGTTNKKLSPHPNQPYTPKLLSPLFRLSGPNHITCNPRRDYPLELSNLLIGTSLKPSCANYHQPNDGGAQSTALNTVALEKHYYCTGTCKLMTTAHIVHPLKIPCTYSNVQQQALIPLSSCHYSPLQTLYTKFSPLLTV